MASAFLFSADSALTTLDAASFSIAFWMRPTLGPTFTQVVLVEGPAFKVVFNTGGTITFTINDSTTSTESSIQTSGTVIANDWNNVIVVYDKTAGTISIYLNGDLDSASYTQPANSSISQYVPDFQFSNNTRTGDPTTTNFDIDSATVWARALTALEAGNLYNGSTGLDYPFAGGPFSLIFQANLINDPEKPLILGSGFQLWSATPSFDSSTGIFTAALDLLFSGIASSQGFDWTGENFFDKVILAQHDNVVQYWQPPLPNVAKPVPGLPTSDDKWDGATVFFDHVMLWKADRIKWSDKGDFSLWIPVDTTVVSTILTTTQDFIQPAPGGLVTVTVSNPVTEVISISLAGSLAFGSVAVGDTAQAILTIENSGTVPLNVTGISFPDGFSGSFSGIIPVNGSVPVVVTFAPTEAIDYIGTITVASNATLGTPSIPVSGTGTGTTKIISLSGVLDFGSLLLSRTLVSSLIITNLGNATLNVSSITLPSGFSGSFSGTVAAGASHVVAITFSPTAVLTYGGFVSVASDATSGGNTFEISGQGVNTLTRAMFLTDNGSLQFGSVAVGSTPTGTLRIYNPGSTSIHVVGISLPGGFTGSFTGNIAAHGFHDVTVTFSPLSGIFYGGVITVATSVSTTHGSTTLSVSGTGVESGKVILLSGTLDFGSVFIGNSSQNILTIANVGDTDLTISSITYPDVVFTGPFAGVIAPGKSVNVLVNYQPTAAITTSGTLTVVSDKTSGTNTRSISGTGVAIPSPEALAVGQFVSIADGHGGFNFYTVISMSGSSVVLQLLDLTGITLPGTLLPTGTQIFSVDANESGETRIAGAKINGPIFRIVPQGDYAFVWKERSISTIQYTGLGNGIFFIHPEVSGEGLIGINAHCTLDDGRQIFLGHKNAYQYQGGPSPTPVCLQTIKQLYSELDRARLYQVKLFNNEQFNEVWFVYPVAGGGFRVMIWNYLEDSASFDDYTPELLFTALGLVDWSSDPTWAQFADAVTWVSLDSSLRWEDLVGASVDHIPLLASLDGNLRVWGTRYAREGAAYTALSESMDYDLGDNDAWKYVDFVRLGLHIAIPSDNTRLLYIQVGCRNDLNDADITWTDPQSILANGHAVTPVKINPGGSGRYLRLRFYSQDVDVTWAISSFEIVTRLGNTY